MEKKNDGGQRRFVKWKKEERKTTILPPSPLFLHLIHISTLTSAPIETIGAKIGSRGERPRAKNCLFFCCFVTGIVSRGVCFCLPFSLPVPVLLDGFFIDRSESKRSYLSACRMAGERERPPPREPDAIPQRAATVGGDATTKLPLVPRPEGDASAGDAQRVRETVMAEALGGEQK